MTYKLITEAELRQAIDALERWYDESGIWPEELHLVDSLLRDVQQREGPRQCAYGFPNSAITGSGPLMMMARIDIPSDDQHGGQFWCPLYSLPEIPQ